MFISLQAELSDRKWDKTIFIDQRIIPLGQPIKNGAQYHRGILVPAHRML
jgi:hypothetical protein